MLSITPSPARIIYLLANKFPNKSSNVPNNIPINPPLCSFASFLIVSLTPFINKGDSSRDFTIFMKAIISSCEINNVVIPDPKMFFQIAASFTEAGAVNSTGIKTFLGNGFSTCSLNTNQFLVMIQEPHLKIFLIV